MSAVKNFNQWAASGTQYRSLAQNYRPLGLELVYAEGPYIFSKDGTPYVDMIMGYGAGQFGHRHPKIVKAIQEHTASQPAISRLVAEKKIVRGQKISVPIEPRGLDLSTRNYTNPILGIFVERLAEFSGIPDAVVLPKNGGGEIIDSAIKVMRADGVSRRGIPENEGIIITFNQNFHGRTYGAVSASTNPGVKRTFGPFLPGFVSVDYNDPEALSQIMVQYSGRISGVMIEPVQGEAGINILDYGSDGATMSGSPLACAIGLAAMDIMRDEGITERSAENGQHLLKKLAPLEYSSFVKDVRGIGSWLAVEFANEATAQAVSNYAVTEESGLCVPSHESLRISTALNADTEIIDEAADVVLSSVGELEKNPRFVQQFSFD